MPAEIECGMPMQERIFSMRVTIGGYPDPLRPIFLSKAAVVNAQYTLIGG